MMYDGCCMVAVECWMLHMFNVECRMLNVESWMLDVGRVDVASIKKIDSIPVRGYTCRAKVPTRDRRQ